MADAIETDIFENSLEGKEAIVRYIKSEAEAASVPNGYAKCYDTIKELDGEYDSRWLEHFFTDEDKKQPTEELIVMYKTVWIEKQIKYYGNCCGDDAGQIFKYISESIRERPLLLIDIGISLGSMQEQINHNILAEYFVDYDETIMFTSKAQELMDLYSNIQVPDEEDLDLAHEMVVHMPKYLSPKEAEIMNEEMSKNIEKAAQLRMQKKQMMKLYNNDIEEMEGTAEANSRLLNKGAEDSYALPCKVLYNTPTKGMKTYVAFSKNTKDSTLRDIERRVVKVIPMDDHEPGYSMFDNSGDDDWDDVEFEEPSNEVSFADESIDDNDVEPVTATDDSEYQAEIELSDSFDEDETQLN